MSIFKNSLIVEEFAIKLLFHNIADFILNIIFIIIFSSLIKKYIHFWENFKTVKTVFNGFIEIINESNRKPNKLWVDQGTEFYNKIMQEW